MKIDKTYDKTYEVLDRAAPSPDRRDGGHPDGGKPMNGSDVNGSKASPLAKPRPEPKKSRAQPDTPRQRIEAEALKALAEGPESVREFEETVARRRRESEETWEAYRLSKQQSLI